MTDINGDARVAAEEALIEAGFVDPDDGTVPRWHGPLPVWTNPMQVVDVVIAAALPHLRVQETPAASNVRESLAAARRTLNNVRLSLDIDPDLVDTQEILATQRLIASALALPAPHPRPVVDREALRSRLWVALTGSPGGFSRDELAEILADAVLALLPTEEGEGETTHLIADGEAITRCCGRTPFELPHTDRITMDPSLARGCDDWVATATRLGFELGKAEGRKEALTEAEAAIDAKEVWYREMHQPYTADGCSSAAMVVREMASQPSGATPEPLAAPTGHSNLPEYSRPPQEPCEDPDCPIALMHSHPEVHP